MGGTLSCNLGYQWCLFDNLRQQSDQKLPFALHGLPSCNLLSTIKNPPSFPHRVSTVVSSAEQLHRGYEHEGLPSYVTAQNTSLGPPLVVLVDALEGARARCLLESRDTCILTASEDTLRLAVDYVPLVIGDVAATATVNNGHHMGAVKLSTVTDSELSSKKHPTYMLSSSHQKPTPPRLPPIQTLVEANTEALTTVVRGLAGPPYFAAAGVAGGGGQYTSRDFTLALLEWRKEKNSVSLIPRSISSRSSSCSSPPPCSSLLAAQLLVEVVDDSLQDLGRQQLLVALTSRAVPLSPAVAPLALFPSETLPLMVHGAIGLSPVQFAGMTLVSERAAALVAAVTATAANADINSNEKTETTEGANSSPRKKLSPLATYFAKIAAEAVSGKIMRTSLSVPSTSSCSVAPSPPPDRPLQRMLLQLGPSGVSKLQVAAKRAAEEWVDGTAARNLWCPEQSGNDEGGARNKIVRGKTRPPDTVKAAALSGRNPTSVATAKKGVYSELLGSRRRRPRLFATMTKHNDLLLLRRGEIHFVSRDDERKEGGQRSQDGKVSHKGQQARRQRRYENQCNSRVQCALPFLSLPPSSLLDRPQRTMVRSVNAGSGSGPSNSNGSSIRGKEQQEKSGNCVRPAPSDLQPHKGPALSYWPVSRVEPPLLSDARVLAATTSTSTMMATAAVATTTGHGGRGGRRRSGSLGSGGGVGGFVATLRLLTPHHWSRTSVGSSSRLGGGAGSRDSWKTKPNDNRNSSIVKSDSEKHKKDLYRMSDRGIDSSKKWNSCGGTKGFKVQIPQGNASSSQICGDESGNPDHEKQQQQQRLLFNGDAESLLWSFGECGSLADKLLCDLLDELATDPLLMPPLTQQQQQQHQLQQEQRYKQQEEQQQASQHRRGPGRGGRPAPLATLQTKKMLASALGICSTTKLKLSPTTHGSFETLVDSQGRIPSASLLSPTSLPSLLSSSLSPLSSSPSLSTSSSPSTLLSCSHASLVTDMMFEAELATTPTKAFREHSSYSAVSRSDVGNFGDAGGQYFMEKGDEENFSFFGSGRGGSSFESGDLLLGNYDNDEDVMSPMLIEGLRIDSDDDERRNRRGCFGGDGIDGNVSMDDGDEVDGTDGTGPRLRLFCDTMSGSSIVSGNDDSFNIDGRRLPFDDDEETAYRNGVGDSYPYGTSDAGSAQLPSISDQAEIASNNSPLLPSEEVHQQAEEHHQQQQQQHDNAEESAVSRTTSLEGNIVENTTTVLTRDHPTRHAPPP